MNHLFRSEIRPYMQWFLHIHIMVPGVLALIGCMDANAARQQVPAEITLELGSGVIKAEVANTPASREHGMMQRKHLGINRGMLFVLDTPETVCLWMKNTGIPLSAAFIDNSGVITKTVDLEPNSKEEKCAPVPIRYILEVNRHWFDQNGVNTGGRIYNLPKSP